MIKERDILVGITINYNTGKVDRQLGEHKGGMTLDESLENMNYNMDEKGTVEQIVINNIDELIAFVNNGKEFTVEGIRNSLTKIKITEVVSNENEGLILACKISDKK